MKACRYIETLNISKNVAIFNNENCSRNSSIFVSISSNNKWKPPLYHWNSLFYLKISPLGCYLARLFSLFNIFFSKKHAFYASFLYTFYCAMKNWDIFGAFLHTHKHQKWSDVLLRGFHWPANKFQLNIQQFWILKIINWCFFKLQ